MTARTRRSLGNLLAMVALFVADLLQDSWLKIALVTAGSGYILIAIVIQARTGYLRRRPFWTAGSWRRFLAVCALGAAALLVSIAMMMAVEWHLPIAGPSNSDARGTWAAVMLGFMVVGVLAIAIPIEWLATGEPSRQFGWPGRLAR